MRFVAYAYKVVKEPIKVTKKVKWKLKNTQIIAISTKKVELVRQLPLII